MQDVRDTYEMHQLYNDASTSYDWRGSYLGFTYGGIHSSELGIVRTSASNRYDDQLLPASKAKTVEVPGGDGSYFFGQQFTQRQFTVNFAFDHLTDEQLRTLRAALGHKTVKPLIFDETPYKVYAAAVTGNATAKHLCFDDNYYGRVYKGEGTIQFTCFYPYARSRYKFLEDYNLNSIPEWGNDESFRNIDEWKAASGMVLKTKGYDQDTLIDIGHLIELYNPGDIDTDWIINIPKDLITDTFQIRFSRLNSEIIGRLNINNITSWITDDLGIQINSKTQLIQGYTNQGIVPNHVYNQYISAGTFVKIPKGETHLVVANIGTTDSISIEYDYLYF